jgi:hypothetical protein
MPICTPSTGNEATAGRSAGASLPVLQAGGFGASVDAFAWEPDPDPAARCMRLWFVSLLGPHQALKALWARLVKGELATLSRGVLGQVHFCTLAPEGPRAWRSFTASLPTAAGHQLVLIPEAARHAAGRDDFLLLPRSEEDAPQLYFRFLDRRVDLPLHARWRAWLWERAVRAGEAVALEADGIRAYRCTPIVEAITTELSAAVRDGVLRVQDDGVIGGSSR